MTQKITYKKLDEETLEATITKEEKVIIKKDQVLANKANLESFDKTAAIAEQDALLAEFEKK